jgi:hypothetical protein
VTLPEDEPVGDEIQRWLEEQKKRDEAILKWLNEVIKTPGELERISKPNPATREFMKFMKSLGLQIYKRAWDDLTTHEQDQLRKQSQLLRPELYERVVEERDQDR